MLIVVTSYVTVQLPGAAAANRLWRVLGNVVLSYCLLGSVTVYDVDPILTVKVLFCDVMVGWAMGRRSRSTLIRCGLSEVVNVRPNSMVKSQGLPLTLSLESTKMTLML